VGQVAFLLLEELERRKFDIGPAPPEEEVEQDGKWDC
jgi:hypothetical protein